MRGCAAGRKSPYPSEARLDRVYVCSEDNAAAGRQQDPIVYYCSICASIYAKKKEVRGRPGLCERAVILQSYLYHDTPKIAQLLVPIGNYRFVLLCSVQMSD